MSPESRRSHLPGQLRPLNERPAVTIPSWEETRGMLELLTHNNSEENEFVKNHQKDLRQAYDGWYDLATGKGRAKLDKFSKRKSGKRLDELGPYTSFIRNKVMSGRN